MREELRRQLKSLMDACGDDANLRCAIRKEWAMYHYRKNKWCGYLDPDRNEVRRMVAVLLRKEVKL